MLKFIIAIATCFVSFTTCFSFEVPRNVEIFGQSIPPSALYASCGHAHLLLKDFEMALSDFRRASACLEQFEGSTLPTEVVIQFGQAVACDNLNLRDECEHSLSQLILNISKIESLQDDDEYEEELENDSSSNELEEYVYNNFVDTVRNIASLAPSEEVREILMSLVDALEEDDAENI